MIQILDSHIAHPAAHVEHPSVYAVLTKDIAEHLNVFVLFNRGSELKCYLFLNSINEKEVVKTGESKAGDMPTVAAIAELYLLGQSGKNSLFSEELNHILKGELYEQVLVREGQMSTAARV